MTRVSTLKLGPSLGSVSGDLPQQPVSASDQQNIDIRGQENIIIHHGFLWSQNHQSKFMKHKSRSLINSQQLVLNGGITAAPWSNW